MSGVLERIGRPRVFVLDFSDVPMVDSTGAKTLKRLAEKLALTGTLIFITGASLKVRRSLLLAGLSKPIIRYAKTADQAVRFSRASRPSCYRLGARLSPGDKLVIPARRTALTFHIISST